MCGGFGLSGKMQSWTNQTKINSLQLVVSAKTYCLLWFHGDCVHLPSSLLLSPVSTFSDVCLCGFQDARHCVSRKTWYRVQLQSSAWVSP